MNKTKTAVLSISLLNILMNAGIVPVLSILAAALPDAAPAALKFTLSISSIFCVVFSLLTGYLDRYIPRKVLLSIGLIFYAAGGAGGGLVNSITGLLFTRALIGIGGGICIPLSTAYIADLYDGEERRKTIGDSLFAANLGAMALPLIGTWLAQVNWRLGFLIYLVALLALVLAWLYIPDLPITKATSQPKKKLFYFSDSVLWAAFLYFFVMVLFVALPSNFSLFVQEENLGTPSTAAWLTTFSTLSAMLISPLFSRIYRVISKWMLTIGLFLCGIGFAILSALPGLWASLAGNILIGGGLGMLHPLFPYMAMQTTLRENSTSALALVSSGFRLGTFVSPMFFLLANSLTGILTIRFEFMVSAVVFAASVVISAIIFSRKPA